MIVSMKETRYAFEGGCIPYIADLKIKITQRCIVAFREITST